MEPHEVRYAVANGLLSASPATVREHIAQRLAERNALPHLPPTASNLARINEEYTYCKTKGGHPHDLDGTSQCLRQESTKAILVLARRIIGGAA